MIELCMLLGAGIALATIFVSSLLVTDAIHRHYAKRDAREAAEWLERERASWRRLGL